MKISVNIATHKPRLPFLKQVIESLLKQNTKPDIVNVYFGECEIPEWFKKFKGLQLNAIIGKDLGASGKFYSSEEQTEGVYITLDDDLIPNPSYIGYMADSAMRYPNSIVGLHGTIYGNHPIKSYYQDESRTVFYCYDGLDGDKAVDMLGTGAIAFRSALVSKPILSDFKAKNATDPSLCVKAKKNKIPLICLTRKTGFVQEIKGSQDSAIWKQLLKGDTKQTKTINSVKDFERIYNRNRIDTSKFGDASIEWNHLKEILSVITIDKNVCEFGSGKSTAVLHGISNLISFEHNREYHTKLTMYRPIKKGWYSLTDRDKLAVELCDVIIIDGPIGRTNERYNIPKSIIKSFKEDSIIFVDDCHRPKDLELAETIAEITGKALTIIGGKEKSMAKIQ